MGLGENHGLQGPLGGEIGRFEAVFGAKLYTSLEGCVHEGDASLCKAGTYKNPHERFRGVSWQAGSLGRRR